MVTRPAAWISAADAAARLGVTRATLYAYVSRGFLRSQAMPGATRARGYARDDVERLRQRTDDRRDPGRAAAHALQWGMPLLESAITMIDGHRLYYRGQDAVLLARTNTVEEVASLIWTGRIDAVAQLPPARNPPARCASRRRSGPFVARAQSALSELAAADALAFDARPQHVVRCGWSILRRLTAVATGTENPSLTIDGALGRAWKLNRHGVDLIRRALVLCADHELNVSSFTARCVASAGGSPYGVVIAGLAALEGPRHGGASARVAAMMASMPRSSRWRQTLSERLRRGEPLDGFGHPLYPRGDPRATEIMNALRTDFDREREGAFVMALADAVTALRHEPPNIDFALAGLARVLNLPADAPLILFAIGRTIGWIGHAIEQYATGQLIRPRAKYVGVVPTAG